MKHPDELNRFVQQSIASGAYHSTDEFFVCVLANLKEQAEPELSDEEERRLAALRADIQPGVDQLDRGKSRKDLDWDAFLVERRRNFESRPNVGRTCQMCGSAEGDKCLNDGLPISLHLIAILQFRLGGRVEEDNLRTACSSCALGVQAIEKCSRKLGTMQLPERKECIQLLTQVRRATVEDQKAVAHRLFNKFKRHTPVDE